METPKEQWPMKAMYVSFSGALILIIISCYIIQTTWMQSAFGAR